jgi:hypothetical protein
MVSAMSPLNHVLIIISITVITSARSSGASPDRTRTFALFNVFTQAGAPCGPMLGEVLPLTEFRVVASTAALAFLAAHGDTGAGAARAGRSTERRLGAW